MAAGKWKAYDKAKLRLLDGTIDLDDTTNWKIALFLSTSNCNNLAVGTGVFGDLTNEHAAANGYPAGGASVASETLADVAGTTTFDAADASYTASGGSIIARFAVMYKNATVNGIVKPLLGVCLLNTTPADIVVADGTTFTLVQNAAGLFTLSGAAVD